MVDRWDGGGKVGSGGVCSRVGYRWLARGVF